MTLQGIAGLLTRHEGQCTDTEPKRRQFAEVAGTVLLDVEMTVKLVSQGKVRCTAGRVLHAAAMSAQSPKLAEQTVMWAVRCGVRLYTPGMPAQCCGSCL